MTSDKEKEEKSILCCVCGKEMYDPILDYSAIGGEYKFFFLPAYEAFCKKQLGNYKINHSYYICFECVLRNAGIPEEPTK
jgi:hypothetical protein